MARKTATPALSLSSYKFLEFGWKTRLKHFKTTTTLANVEILDLGEMETTARG